MAGTVVYSSAKSFASYLAIGLEHELKGRVDCLAFEPAAVATKFLVEIDGNITVKP
jgi:short-subunit dehydrogenase